MSVKKIFTAAMIQLLCLAFIFNISQAESKKKLFINNITPKNGASNEIAQKARDYLTLSMFENFDRYYQIITDDDIKVMYQQAELMMSSGNESENAIIQVANAINADEIIYGHIMKDGENYLFTVQNLQRDNKSQSVAKKSYVSKSFFESKMEWYCKEIAKKLIKPDYDINEAKSVSKIVAKFNVEEIKLNKFEGVNIRKIKFESQDEISSRIVNDLMKVVEKGDEYYKEKKYDDALDEYRETIAVIAKKLRKETQKKIEPFVESVLERIAAVHSVSAKEEIDEVDRWLKEQNPITEDVLKKGKTKYENIVKPLLKLPSHERIKMDSILNAIEDRLTSICLTWVSLFEAKGDALYADYQFKSAIKNYDDGIYLINNSGVKNEKITNARERMENKRKITQETGASWLENKVLSYCNAAEYLNMKGSSWKAEDYLLKAKKMIEANKTFANQRMVTAYKETARIIKK